MAPKVLVLIGLFTCLCIGVYKQVQPPANAASEASAVSGGVVHLSGPDLATRTRNISLDDYVGQPVIVNVWASWCAACRDEAFTFARLERERPDMLIIGLDISEPPKDALAAMTAWNWKHESIWNLDGQLVAGLPHHGGLPTTYFLDSQHHMVDFVVGAATYEQLLFGTVRITGHR